MFEDSCFGKYLIPLMAVWDANARAIESLPKTVCPLVKFPCRLAIYPEPAHSIALGRV